MRNKNNIKEISSRVSSDKVNKKKKRIRNAKEKMDRGSELKIITISIFVLIIMIPLAIFIVDKLSAIIE